MSGVVITGIGVCSPLGSSSGASWRALLDSRSGIVRIDESFRSRFSLPTIGLGLATLDPQRVSAGEARRLDRSSQLALASTREAWRDAAPSVASSERLAVVVGTALGGLMTTMDTVEQFYTADRIHRVRPAAIPMLIPNAAAAAIAIDVQARGAVRTISSACASGTEALKDAFDLITSEESDVVVVCSSDAMIHPTTIAGFAAMNALADGSTDASRSSAPFALDRSGLVLGEGAAAVVLESADHAERRGAQRYASVLGAGVTSDSHHMVAPEPSGDGAYRAMRLAIENASIEPADVSHVNAHATGTPLGDAAEYLAMRRLFGNGLPTLPLSATKASTGHLLGGGGVLEAIFAILALRSGVVPPTITPRERFDTSFQVDVSNVARPFPTPPRFALSNSFGFGGHNAVVAFRSV